MEVTYTFYLEEELYRATQKVAEVRGSSVEEEILEAIRACVAEHEKKMETEG